MTITKTKQLYHYDSGCELCYSCVHFIVFVENPPEWWDLRSFRTFGLRHLCLGSTVWTTWVTDSTKLNGWENRFVLNTIVECCLDNVGWNLNMKLYWHGFLCWLEDVGFPIHLIFIFLLLTLQGRSISFKGLYFWRENTSIPSMTPWCHMFP